MHRAPWPTVDELGGVTDGDPGVLAVAAEVLGEVRRAKTEAKRSLRTEVTSAVVHLDDVRAAQLEAARGDVTDAGVVTDLVVVTDAAPDAGIEVEVTLVPDDTPPA